jgi:hypothetical protein
LEDPISKNEKGAAGVTQGVGPEFKQQCRKKKDGMRDGGERDCYVGRNRALTYE